jgi:hypothetical protein
MSFPFLDCSTIVTPFRLHQHCQQHGSHGLLLPLHRILSTLNALSFRDNISISVTNPGRKSDRRWSEIHEGRLSPRVTHLPVSFKCWTHAGLPLMLETPRLYIKCMHYIFSLSISWLFFYAGIQFQLHVFSKVGLTEKGRVDKFLLKQVKHRFRKGLFQFC